MTEAGPRAGGLSVALDVSAVPDEPVGAGRYTLELARELDARDDVELSLFSRRSDASRWPTIAPGAALRGVAPDNRVLRLAYEELLLARACAKAERAASVMHAPHYNAPRSSRIPVVITVHDLTMVDHPEWHERSKVAFFKRALRLAAAHASAIICPSATTADAFSERYKPKARVHVVAHGIDHERFSAEEPTAGFDAEVRGRLCVPGRYVFHLGTIEPRKNLPGLIAAFDIVAEHDRDLSLVLAGQIAWGKAELEDALGRARHRERITALGYVSESDVPSLLRGASAVAYPSFAEGFGLPALEALACGAPLVTSEKSPMAEVSDGIAWLVEPNNLEALADALASAIEHTDPQRRSAGITRAAGYTWQACAQGHVLAYRQAIGNL